MSRRTEKRRNSILILFIFIFFTLNVALASKEVVYKDARYPKKIFKVQKEIGKQEIVSAEKVGVGYFYDPAGKTDPFKSFIAEQEEIAVKKRKRPRTYLETLDLSQLELIAVIVSPKGNWAMVRDSKGLGHVIKKGTPIGTNNGVVYQIKDQVVVIREEHKDFRGRIKYKDIDKRLPTL